MDGSVGKCKQKALSESRKVKHIALFHLHHGLALWDELSKFTLYHRSVQFNDYMKLQKSRKLFPNFIKNLKFLNN